MHQKIKIVPTFLIITFVFFFISACRLITLNLQYPNTFRPNFFADAPWRVSSLSSDIPVLVYIKDADKNHLKIYKIQILNNLTNQIVRQFSPENLIVKTTPFVTVFPNLTPRNLGIKSSGQTADITVAVTFRDFELKHTFRQRLQVYVGEPLPSLANWYPGDTHFHSDYTNNKLETGIGLLKGDYYRDEAIVKRMGRAIGLNWVTVTDHSCDFGDDDFKTSRGGEISQWAQMAADCRRYSDSRFVIVPAEEVTLGSLTNHRTHLLVYNAEQYIDGPETGFFGKLFTDRHEKEFIHLDDTLPVIKTINNGKSFCYAAHPMAKADTVLGIHMKGLEWKKETIQKALTFNTFRGFEIWNTRSTAKIQNITMATGKVVNPFPWKYDEHWDQELENGLIMWDRSLLENLAGPRKIFIEGGSDAHGHFNYAIVFRYLFRSIPVPDYVAKDNAFGEVRTYVYSENGLSETSILDALRDGHSVVSDGPLLIFGIDRNDDGILSKEDGDIIPGDDCDVSISSDVRFFVKWRSNSRYRDIEDGRIDQIWAVYAGESSSSIGKKMISIPGRKNTCYWRPIKPNNPANSFYRMEAYVLDHYGRKRYRGYTNPIWIKWTE